MTKSTPENASTKKILEEALKNQEIEQKDGEKTTKTQTPALGHPLYEELLEKLNEAEAQVNDYMDRALRTQAEAENMKRRAERDVANAHRYGLERFVDELLPVIDSLEYGIQNAAIGNHEAIKALQEGMELTLNLLLKAVAKFGVKQLAPLGEVFNPEFHQVVSMQETTEAEPNSIVHVLQKGYTLNDRLVRPALVIIAKGA